MGKHVHVEPAAPAKSIKGKPETAKSVDKAALLDIPIKPAPKALKDKPEPAKSRAKPEPEWTVPKSEFIKVKIAEIDDAGYNAREKVDENAPEFAELCQSIREVGLVEPIVLTEVTDPKKVKTGVRYELVAGFRRFRALKKCGVRETMAVKHQYTHPSQRIIVNLLENQHRVDLRAYEQAVAFKKLREEGFRVETISNKLGISEAKISNYVSCVENLVPELLGIFKKNSEGTALTQLIQLSRAPKEEQQAFFRALSMQKPGSTDDKAAPKDKSDKGPKVRNKDQLGAFLGDLMRAESIVIDGEEVVIESADPREAIETAIRWARGEIKSSPLVLPPQDKSDQKRRWEDG